MGSYDGPATIEYRGVRIPGRECKLGADGGGSELIGQRVPSGARVLLHLSGGEVREVTAASCTSCLVSEDDGETFMLDLYA